MKMDLPSDPQEIILEAQRDFILAEWMVEDLQKKISRLKQKRGESGVWIKWNEGGRKARRNKSQNEVIATGNRRNRKKFEGCRWTKIAFAKSNESKRKLDLCLNERKI